jgi:hypothetical protein
MIPSLDVSMNLVTPPSILASSLFFNALSKLSHVLLSPSVDLIFSKKCFLFLFQNVIPPQVTGRLLFKVVSCLPLFSSLGSTTQVGSKAQLFLAPPMCLHFFFFIIHTSQLAHQYKLTQVFFLCSYDY